MFHMYKAYQAKLQAEITYITKKSESLYFCQGIHTHIHYRSKVWKYAYTLPFLNIQAKLTAPLTVPSFLKGFNKAKKPFQYFFAERYLF